MLFHPGGFFYRAEVEPIARDGALVRLAERLAGIALVRLSGALWEWPHGKRTPDLLGAVIRFRSSDQVTPPSLPGDQDLCWSPRRRCRVSSPRCFVPM